MTRSRSIACRRLASLLTCLLAFSAAKASGEETDRPPQTETPPKSLTDKRKPDRGIGGTGVVTVLSDAEGISVKVIHCPYL